MTAVLIFDLDDTLYPEEAFVASGFRAVADDLQANYGWDAAESLATMNQLLSEEGRGAVFDQMLARRGRLTAAGVRRCLNVYRQHAPDIRLYPAAETLLSRLPARPYIVTDGNKLVQQNKVTALGLEPRCSKIFITHRYGVRHAKPSIHCFDRIRTREGCDWHEMVYVADNPAKDFVNLTPLGVHTVRVLTGAHRCVKAAPGHEARDVIESLDALPQLLPHVRWRQNSLAFS
jgi:putative hydrolase of the HAD superfamily